LPLSAAERLGMSIGQGWPVVWRRVVDTEGNQATVFQADVLGTLCNGVIRSEQVGTLLIL